MARTARTAFILYLERISALAVPPSRRSKAQLYAVLTELEKEPRFAGKALLRKLIAQISDYL
jgi:hypothetical protein